MLLVFSHAFVAPNFGWNLALNLKIDGRTAANIVQGRRYDHFAPGGRSLL
jgi:hypothetical protein